MGIIVLGNKIYISGGSDFRHYHIFTQNNKENIYNNFYMINVDTETIHDLPKMSMPRYQHGFIKYMGDFWAIGGSDGDMCIKLVESFDPTLNIWTPK